MLEQLSAITEYFSSIRSDLLSNVLCAKLQADLVSERFFKGIKQSIVNWMDRVREKACPPSTLAGHSFNLLSTLFMDYMNKEILSPALVHGPLREVKRILSDLE